jgi:hypothetical protein
MSHEIEDLLRRYQPSAAPPDLRARVLAPPVEAGRTWPWLAGAAAALIATVGLHLSTPRLPSAWIEPMPDDRARAIAELADMLGGNEAAQRVAATIVVRDEAAKEAAREAVPVGTSGTDQ